ncbi:hypothetical protein PUN28_006794 [Cardiocondyla obscurior]|uniref:Uncharacterized protein n=1 Tax=Cardiocondyla obscurior TaxID=286306 RepID=A0AAW2G4Z7_9HYME
MKTIRSYSMSRRFVCRICNYARENCDQSRFDIDVIDFRKKKNRKKIRPSLISHNPHAHREQICKAKADTLYKMRDVRHVSLMIIKTISRCTLISRDCSLICTTNAFCDRQ